MTRTLDDTFQGWKNYETWNITLWIQNDYELYRLAKQCKTYKELVQKLYDIYGVKETFDGVSFTDPKICIEEVEGVLEDL